MKPLFFILFLFLFFSSFQNDVTAQSVPDYSLYEKMSSGELELYRQSVWDSLPAIGWVNDFGGLLTNNEEDSLESLLQHFEKETTVEISILTVDSNMVHKDRFNDFSDHILKTWRIGKLLKKNGIVICISKDYKKLFISTGAGISRYISDPEKNRLIQQSFIPQYIEHNYFTGTLNGVNEIINRISSKMNRFQK